jgi:hypothetical protein
MSDELELRKIKLQEQELEFKRAQLDVEFAKFGFSGTLTAGIGGMVLILALAIIDAVSSDFTYGTYGVVGTAICVVLGALGFGAFSHRQRVNLLGKWGDKSIGFNSDHGEKTRERSSDG